ncbi:uncharacterized protein LOC101862416 isoform X2 [Aplysia californica]|uniref:Uncharacterized protein LOC101862416 isoform X2 n=1 Tax=Aplysia californica TaxID=6500 RepID=A0ABM1VTU0_APLCA|nr:uncharacterized protein LOC101862416 isoform X2 [Aplysia californica]
MRRTAVSVFFTEWFENCASSVCNTSAPADPEELHNTLKFSGDFHYGQKQFSKAAKQYEAVLDVLPESNVSVAQDVRESLCRCYSHCGRHEESLNLAKQLVSELATEDIARQRQSLILYSSVCEMSGRWAECVEALERLCCIQPYYDKFWRQLGGAYMKLTSELSSINASDHTSSCTAGEYLELALTCFVRARLLLQSSLFRASDIIKERNKQLIEQTTETVNKLPLPEDQKEYANQCMMKSDTETVDSQNDEGTTQDLAKDSSAQVSNSKLFYEKFCSWIEQYHRNLQQSNT